MPSKQRDFGWLIALLVGLVLAFGIVIGDQLEVATHRIKTNQTLIQRERFDTVYAACQDQNNRHDATVAALERIWTHVEKTHPRQTLQVEAQKAPTLTIITALAPKQDCANVAKAATSTVVKGP